MPETEKATLYYQNRTIRYTIRRSARRRTVGITIDPQGVRVAAPQRMPLEQVVAVVNTKARWSFYIWAAGLACRCKPGLLPPAEVSARGLTPFPSQSYSTSTTYLLGV